MRKKRVCLTKDDKKAVDKQYRACWRKRRYATKAAAESVVFKMKYKNKSKYTLNSYQCKFCGGFHTGNS